LTLLLPGGIDAHVHLSTPPGPREGPRWVDDFTSGSAALAGGITTLGNMAFLAPGETPLAGLAHEAATARAQPRLHFAPPAQRDLGLCHRGAIAQDDHLRVGPPARCGVDGTEATEHLAVRGHQRHPGVGDDIKIGVSHIREAAAHR
jgi:hypothetical protein